MNDDAIGQATQAMRGIVETWLNGSSVDKDAIVGAPMLAALSHLPIREEPGQIALAESN